MVRDDELVVISSDDSAAWTSDKDTDSNQSEDDVEDDVEHPQEVTFRGNCSCSCLVIAHVAAVISHCS